MAAVTSSHASSSAAADWYKYFFTYATFDGDTATPRNGYAGTREEKFLLELYNVCMDWLSTPTSNISDATKQVIEMFAGMCDMDRMHKPPMQRVFMSEIEAISSYLEDALEPYLMHKVPFLWSALVHAHNKYKKQLFVASNADLHGKAAATPVADASAREDAGVNVYRPSSPVYSPSSPDNRPSPPPSPEPTFSPIPPKPHAIFTIDADEEDEEDEDEIAFDKGHEEEKSHSAACSSSSAPILQTSDEANKTKILFAELSSDARVKLPNGAMMVLSATTPINLKCIERDKPGKEVKVCSGACTIEKEDLDDDDDDESSDSDSDSSSSSSSSSSESESESEDERESIFDPAKMRTLNTYYSTSRSFEEDFKNWVDQGLALADAFCAYQANEQPPNKKARH